MDFLSLSTDEKLALLSDFTFSGFFRDMEMNILEDYERALESGDKEGTARVEKYYISCIWSAIRCTAEAEYVLKKLGFKDMPIDKYGNFEYEWLNKEILTIGGGFGEDGEIEVAMSPNGTWVKGVRVSIDKGGHYCGVYILPDYYGSREEALLTGLSEAKKRIYYYGRNATTTANRVYKKLSKLVEEAINPSLFDVLPETQVIPIQQKNTAQLEGENTDNKSRKNGIFKKTPMVQCSLLTLCE